MPFFYRRRWYRPTYYRRRFNTYQRRRRIRYRQRRSRNAFRKRRRHRVRKNFYYKRKKKLTLSLRQWQPETIRKSKIKGIFTLFACNEGRGANNYPQYRDSFVPQHHPGGGGWGIYVFNLGALFDEFLRIRNWWTVSNVNLPLCRYIYCRLTFYRAEKVDYVVHYTTSYPMTDSDYKHAEAQPSRLLMRRRKIIVQSRQHTNKKPYIRKKIKAPRQLINKWFFQREFINTNLLMLTVSACSLTHFDMPPKAITNNIYLQTLNPYIFQNLNYHQLNTTEPWKPKANTYFYGIELSQTDLTKPTPLKDHKYGELTFLGQAMRRTEGTSISDSKKNATDYFKQENSNFWGNVFHESYIHHEKHIVTSNVQYTQITNKDDKIDTTKYTLFTQPIFQQVIYNPDKDTGKNTTIYFVPNFQSLYEWKVPENEQLKFHGFPLWMLLWGWPDWQKKLGLINQIDQHYILIIESDAFEPKLPKYMFLDMEFLDNTLEFPIPNDTGGQNKPLLTDDLSWHPKFLYQQKSIDKICMSGPATHKFINGESIEAHMEYSFHFKWGGTPSTMETIADPSKQPSFPVPNNLTTTLQIQNPATDPRDLIYTFDTRRNYLTQKAIDRISEYKESDEHLPIFTDFINPQPPPKTEKDLLQTFLETQTKEEEKAQRIQLFQHLREQQQQLQYRIQQLVLQNLKSPT